MDLKTDIQYVKGIGEKRAELLRKELEIYQVEDLLYYFPYKHIDKSEIKAIRDIHSGIQTAIQLKGRISNMELIGQGRSQRLTAILSDYSGSIQLVWFKGIKWIRTGVKEGVEYVVFGKPTLFNGRFNITHPELEQESQEPSKGIVPQYTIPEKLKNKFINSKIIQKAVLSALNSIEISDPYPSSFLQENRLIPLKKALKNIHFPENTSLLKQAENRIKFDEFFYIQLKLLLQKTIRKREQQGHTLSKIGVYFNSYFNHHLAFELTNAQKRVIKEIRADVKSGKQMNRLLQGDVGSGKTMVALFAMLMAVDNNLQAAMMAPTEILASQHYNSLKDDLEAIGVRSHLLTGSTKKSERAVIHEELLSGKAQILFGTHALIEDTVVFKSLGLVVIDEQHRFGVAQRAKFWKKNTIPPHVLIMTATPIPRTLSMTLYGDLDVSVIDELPPGRKAIKTQHYYDGQVRVVHKFMKEQIALGRQIYIVYPLIKESEKMDYMALEEGFWALQEHFPAPEYSISIVHGQMKPKDKDYEMQRFVKGETQIMVATTVIEVGVNVPNASVMIIESAERFGLSQLHQLRGRVGRGAEQSYCILKTPYKLSKESKTRISAMVNSTDGFKLAEIDLQLRGPGSIDSTQQSGVPMHFKKANLATDQKELKQARKAAESTLEADPDLSQSIHAGIRQVLKGKYSSKVNWSKIG